MNDIRIELGASSYFSRPSHILDPNLFEGEQLRPHVREEILRIFYNYMDRHYHNAHEWSVVWLAGSGISFQWAASRGNGDLDVLFGIDYSRFVTENPDFLYFDRHEIAEFITNDLRKNLWPLSAHTYFGLGEYEVTFFLNDNVEGTESSIVNIHPYAAYNLTTNKWTVKPPLLSASPASDYPESYYVQAEANKQAAEALVGRFNAVQREGASIYPGSPQDVNNRRSKALVRAEAENLFDSLHLGRKMAFSNQGEGYGDFYNFQWQHAKQHGVINALNEIINKEN
jgi:hypothetical protein